MTTIFVCAFVVALVASVFSTRRARRYKEIRRIRLTRKVERNFGEYFLELAYAKQEGIRCWVRYFRRPWGEGYRVKLECLGEPDAILSVVVNLSLPPKKQIEIRRWGGQPQYFSTDGASFDAAIAEFERCLVAEMHVSV